MSVSQSMAYHYLDDSNKALGMAVLTSTGTSGFIIGPALAGVTVFPAEQYPSVFSNCSFLKEFPVFIPNALVTAGLVVGALLVVFFIQIPTNDTRDYSPLLNEEESTTSLPPKEDCNSVEIGTDDQGKLQVSEPEPESEPRSSWNKFWNGVRNTNVAKVFATKDCIISCILYGMVGFCACAFQELFPLLASTSVRYHGLAMTTSEIGIILLIVSAVIIILQVPVLSFIINTLGARNVFCWAALIQSFVIPLMPLVEKITAGKTAMLIALCAYAFVFRFLVQASYLSVYLLINNTSGEQLNATATSLGFIFTALGRFVSPLVFGPLFSWSLENMENGSFKGFSLNQYFPFLVWSIVSILGMGCLGMLLSKAVDTKK